MKELSIEEKAKRYDEALKVANKYKDTYIMFPSIKKEMFPELAESEDERIRKELIKGISKTRPNTPFLDTNVTREETLAWLEKQGEQKPANKVEPKFNVDDWVIDSQGLCHQIERVIENVTNHTYSYDIVGGGYFNDNTEGVRLWTIQDAKDGDVIFYDGGWTCIFKCIHGIWYSSYCFITADGEFNTGYEEHYIGAKINGDVHPATKEQRDTLFARIKEAGYNWDAEKKELKKIEQNPADKVEPSTFRNKLLELFQNFRWICKDQIMTNGEILEYVDAHIQKLIGTIQKPTWSEEDNRILSTLTKYLEEHGGGIDGWECSFLSKWLKSLKDRLQPKQEWSEEDKETKEWLIEYFKYRISNSNILEEKVNCKKALNLIESLHPQNRWKPSEEQIKAVKEAACYSSVFSGKTIDNLIYLSKQLKKLMEE